LKYISADKRIRAEADLRLRGLNDRNSEITVATEKGIAIGKEEGKAEGKAEGIAIGEEKGKAEGIAIGKQESAIKMLKKSISLEDISEITGLSIEEIKSLKK
jgi:predicted transposase YdaD